MSQLYSMEAEMACITCGMRTTAFHINQIRDKRYLSATVIVGAFLGFFFAERMGIPAPNWFRNAVFCVTIGIYMFQLGRSMYAKGQMQFVGSDNDRLQFKINENQMIWLFRIPNKAYAEIPLFRGGFVVEKELREDRIVYICRGKPTKLVKWAADRVREGYILDRVLRIVNLRVEMSSNAELFPEAHNILEKLAERKKK